MVLSGSYCLIECLMEQNVEYVFGYPGANALLAFDALYSHGKGIKHILTAHEQGAAHAADGYARATGKVGVCLATSGPGATNLVTGIANAYMDSIPMVAITINVSSADVGKDSFQSCDITGITMPITKHNFIVKDVNKLASTLRRAFQIANHGRKGPVVVDISTDCLKSDVEFERLQGLVEEPHILNCVDENEVEEATKLIMKAKKPCILVGGGVNNQKAVDELNKFASILDCPIVDTLMGRGSFDSTNPNHMGMIGVYGHESANTCIKKCDLLIAIGTRFCERSYRETINCDILHIDIDAAEINKNVKAKASILGDCSEVLQLLNAGLVGKYKRTQSRRDWLSENISLKDIFERNEKALIDSNLLSGAYIMNKLDELVKGSLPITSEVGDNQMYASKDYHHRKYNYFITSGGLGTMGFGLGAAIGASMGFGKKQVINIAGDGSFRMNMNELITVSAYKLPIIEIIFHNKALGMIKNQVDIFETGIPNYAILCENTDYVKIAEAIGISGIRVETKEEFDLAIKKALELNEPMVIDAMIN